MKYSVGETIIIRELEILVGCGASSTMINHSGKIAKITSVMHHTSLCWFKLSIDKGVFWWNEDMVKPYYGFCEVKE